MIAWFNLLLAAARTPSTNYQTARLLSWKKLRNRPITKINMPSSVRTGVTTLISRLELPITLTHPSHGHSARSAFHEKAGMSQVRFSLFLFAFSVCSFCFLFPSRGFLNNIDARGACRRQHRRDNRYRQ